MADSEDTYVQELAERLIELFPENGVREMTLEEFDTAVKVAEANAEAAMLAAARPGRYRH